MKNCQIKKLQDRQLNEIVGGDAKLIATTTSATVTCTACLSLLGSPSRTGPPSRLCAEGGVGWL